MNIVLHVQQGTHLGFLVPFAEFENGNSLFSETLLFWETFRVLSWVTSERPRCAGFAWHPYETAEQE